MAISYGVSGDVRSSLGTPSENEYSASSIALGRLRATNVINSYLEKQYPSSTPFAASGDVPALIDTIATDLSVYYLKRDKHRGPAPLSDVIKEEYWDKNIELLKQIRDGELKLPELDAKDTDLIQAPQESHTPIFDEGSIEDQVVDPDRLDEIADSKS